MLSLGVLVARFGRQQSVTVRLLPIHGMISTSSSGHGELPVLILMELYSLLALIQKQTVRGDTSHRVSLYKTLENLVGVLRAITAPHLERSIG